jgi:hypothetical protein
LVGELLENGLDKCSDKKVLVPCRGNVPEAAADASTIRGQLRRATHMYKYPCTPESVIILPEGFGIPGPGEGTCGPGDPGARGPGNRGPGLADPGSGTQGHRAPMGPGGGRKLAEGLIRHLLPFPGFCSCDGFRSISGTSPIDFSGDLFRYFHYLRILYEKITPKDRIHDLGPDEMQVRQSIWGFGS